MAEKDHGARYALVHLGTRRTLFSGRHNPQVLLAASFTSGFCTLFGRIVEGVTIAYPSYQPVSAKWQQHVSWREGSLPRLVPMIVICNISALARWGEAGLARRLGPPVDPPSIITAPSARGLDDATLSAARLEATEQRPLHVLVSAPELRVRAKRVVSHVWSCPLPADALYQLTPDILIASPSFCLQQIAAGSDLARAATAGMEICGGYAKSPNARYGFFSRPSLDTPEGLLVHFENEHGFGARRAREALAYVQAGSRSPMETVLVLLFVLPIDVGGCGLPAPKINLRLDIPPSLQAAIGVPYVTVDLCWPERGIILEYDSYLFHSNQRKVDGDASRNEGLRDLGWMVRSVTAGMLTNDAARWQLVSRVTERFGRSLPSDEAFRLKQRALVDELMRA